MMDASALPTGTIQPRDFADLPGWQDDDHAAAFRALRLSAAAAREHPPKTRSLGLDAEALAAILGRALSLPADMSAEPARGFFETEFSPFEIVPADGPAFFTGYYEPVVEGSLVRTERFRWPLYGVPDDLVEFDPAEPPPGIDPSFRFARRTEEGYSYYPDRAEIEAGFLAGRGLELVYLADPVDAFFIHIQGAARIELAGGGVMRVTYAAKTGHPYTPIGRVLIEMGVLKRGTATMQAIRKSLARQQLAAGTIMSRNRSFIFFREAPVSDPKLGPIAAAKAPLSAGRSLAIDRLIHSFHVPVFIETTLPDGQSFQRLMMAQDTGSAIVGPARGDIFFGSGEEAGAIAGEMAAPGRFVLLAPRGWRPQ